MKKNVILCVNFIVSLMLVSCNTTPASTDYTDCVNKFVGSGGNGRVTPVASVPFGMMQLAGIGRAHV